MKRNGIIFVFFRFRNENRSGQTIQSFPNYLEKNETYNKTVEYFPAHPNSEVCCQTTLGGGDKITKEIYVPVVLGRLTCHKS